MIVLYNIKSLLENIWHAVIFLGGSSQIIVARKLVGKGYQHSRRFQHFCVMTLRLICLAG